MEVQIPVLTPVLVFDLKSTAEEWLCSIHGDSNCVLLPLEVSPLSPPHFLLLSLCDNHGSNQPKFNLKKTTLMFRVQMWAMNGEHLGDFLLQ
jgi:hypothetical protein